MNAVNSRELARHLQAMRDYGPGHFTTAADYERWVKATARLAMISAGMDAEAGPTPRSIIDEAIRERMALLRDAHREPAPESRR